MISSIYSKLKELSKEIFHSNLFVFSLSDEWLNVDVVPDF